MATAGHIPARLWKLLSNSIAVDDLTSVSLALSRETYDLTSYDSVDWSEIEVSTKSWSIDIEFICQYDATEGFDEIFDDFDNGTSVATLLSTGVSGDTTLSGNAKVTAINKSGAVADKVTCSVTYTGTGALTKGTVV